jgi:hypothetical protein
MSIVCVPTSKNCTRWGGFFWRYAAIAAVSTSGYVPLLSALTSYVCWLALNCRTSSFTVSPSCPPIACQKWISVFWAAAGPDTRSVAPRTTSATRTRCDGDDARRMVKPPLRREMVRLGATLGDVRFMRMTIELPPVRAARL